MKLISALLVALVAVAAASAQRIERKFDPSVFSTNASARSTSGSGINVCRKAGTTCDLGCRKTGICVGGANGVFRETSDCSPGFCTQDANGVKCVDSIQECVPNSEEVGCETNGILPDPYNCRNVLACVAGRAVTSEPLCEEDLEYDACTGYCDVAIDNDRCNSVEPLCKGLSSYGPLPSNNRIYYYCVRDSEGLFHPVLGRCERGFFDEETFSCVDSDKHGCFREDTSECGSGGDAE